MWNDYKAKLVTDFTKILHFLLRFFVKEEVLLKWKPIHLCWWFEKYGYDIPRYFIAEFDPPSVTTNAATSITSTTAQGNGNATAEGSAAIDTRGFTFAETATNSDPEIGGTGVTDIVEGGTGTGLFNATLETLTASTNYSFKAYAKNSKGTGYGSVQTFDSAAQGTTYYKNLDDTISVAEDLEKGISLKAIVETVALAEGLLKTGGKSLAESIIGSDTKIFSISKVLSPDDSISVGEDLKKGISLKVLVEAIVLAEGFLKTGIKNLVESIVGSDTRIFSISKVLSDAISSVEEFLSHRITPRYLNGAYGGFYSGSNYWAGSQAASLVGEEFDKNLQDSLQLIDTKILMPIKSLAESISIQDTLSKIIDYVKGLLDSISIADTLSKVIDYVKGLVDSIVASDTIIKVADFVRGLVDSIIALDTIIKSFGKSLIDSIVASDVYTKVVAFVRSLADSISIADTLSKVVSKLVDDILIVLDSISKILGAVRSLVDSIDVSDIITKVATLFRELVDNIIQSDIIGKLLGLKAFVDNINLSDVYSKVTEKVVSSVVVITDTFSRIATYFRSLVDTFNVHDIIDLIASWVIYLTDAIVARDNVLVVMLRYLVDTVKIVDGLVRKVFINLIEALHITDIFFDIDKVLHFLLEDVVQLSDSLAKHVNILVSSVIQIFDSRFLKRLNGQLIQWVKKAKNVVDWVKTGKDGNNYIKIVKKQDDWESEKKDLGLYESNVKSLDDWNKLRKKQ